jgi:hypothetical protein
MAKEETVLQDIIDRLIEIGGCFGMEMDVEKNKSNENFKTVKIMTDQTQLKNVECFKYLGTIFTNYGRCTCEINCRIAMAKDAFNSKRALLT